MDLGCVRHPRELSRNLGPIVMINLVLTLTSEYIELHPLFDGIEFDVAIIGLAGAMQR